MGYHAMLAAHHVGSRGRVVVIEAIPENCEIIRLNLQANHLDHVTLVERAVLDREGTLSMYRHSRQRASAYQHIAEGSDRYEIRMSSLDTVLQEIGITEVDYVRLQINGVEPEGLVGMSNVLRSSPELMIAAMYMREGRHTRDVLLPMLKHHEYYTEIHGGHIRAWRLKH